MRIVSWDIGITNLAYCLMENRNIIEWGIIDIREEGNPKKKDINKIGPILIEKMMTYDKLINVDYILIENQPVLKNPVMKSIQMILFAYYVMAKINHNRIKDIHLISASNKLKVYNGPKIELNIKSSYSRRKKLAILHTNYFLKDNFLKLSFLNQHKKKDDLCDTYLQSLYFQKKMICNISHKSCNEVKLRECKFCGFTFQRQYFKKFKRTNMCYQCHLKCFKWNVNLIKNKKLKTQC